MDEPEEMPPDYAVCPDCGKEIGADSAHRCTPAVRPADDPGGDESSPGSDPSGAGLYEELGGEA